jgi:hypothetical protein
MDRERLTEIFFSWGQRPPNPPGLASLDFELLDGEEEEDFAVERQRGPGVWGPAPMERNPKYNMIGWNKRGHVERDVGLTRQGLELHG